MVDRARSGPVILRKLVIVARAMFGFGLVPFFQTICRETGINPIVKPDEASDGLSECFCFRRQRLQPGEVRRTLAAFAIEHGLRRDVRIYGAAQKAI